MVEDENSNTSYTGRAIHTPMTPGLITRTYTPRKHCQIFTFLTPLRLDDQQYKKALETPKRIPILLPVWPLTPTTIALHSIAFFKASATTRLTFTSVTSSNVVTFAPLKKSLPAPHSPCPPILPSLFHPALHPQSTALATPPTLLPLPLLKARPNQKWPFPTSK